MHLSRLTCSVFARDKILFSPTLILSLTRKSNGGVLLCQVRLGECKSASKALMTASRMVQRPTREEWRQHRDEIVRLYVNEDMHLDEVRQLMERKYNFRAKCV